MRSLAGIFLLLLLTAFTSTKTPVAYKIYDAKGKKVSYKKMIKTLLKEDVVFFGELHNSSIAHWLEYEVATSLLKERSLVMGMEMFEADQQKFIDLYLKDSIPFHTFKDSVELWPNFATDYQQLLDLANDKGLPLVATNVPRRYARQVHYGGLDTLDHLWEEEKVWMAPQPMPFDIELPTYQKILKMMSGHHGGENLVKAQAIKDATMAYFITQNIQEGTTFLHFNGGFHTDYHEGIIWYLSQYNPDLTHASITTVVQNDIYSLDEEHLGKADFIICIDENVTNSY